MAESDPICPLCGRPIPPGAAQSRHHLVPRLKGGKGGETVLLHHICHKEIHASLTEAELAQSYTTIAALRDHPGSRASSAGWRSARRNSSRARRATGAGVSGSSP